MNKPECDKADKRGGGTKEKAQEIQIQMQRFTHSHTWKFL